MSKPGEYHQILYSALHSPCGIVLYSDDPMRLRAKLYAVRRELGDPELDALSFVESPVNPTEHLWVVKRKPDSET